MAGFNTIMVEMTEMSQRKKTAYLKLRNDRRHLETLNTVLVFVIDQNVFKMTEKN